MINEHLPTQQKYLWEEWFARESFHLVKGIDYTISTRGMIQQIRNMVSQYTSDGKPIKVSIQTDDENDEIFVKVLT